MHPTQFWTIAEAGHEILNPISADKLELLAGYCDVQDGMRVLDVGCGKGWLSRSWARRWAIELTGLELNPSFHRHACDQAAREGLADRLDYVQGPALDFAPAPGCYDIALCIGATFALDGLTNAVDWLRRAARPEGVLAIGEVFAARPFPPEAARPEPLGLAQTVQVLEQKGLEVIAVIPATTEDWDRYYSQQWHAIQRWAADHPDDPLRQPVLDRIRAARSAYFAWERRCYGWGIFVLKSRL
jgi:2-polyprenyl-3-methyl-5-hydroxy-6-metoxy-1,4-benzoquinol methylase